MDYFQKKPNEGNQDDREFAIQYFADWVDILEGCEWEQTGIGPIILLQGINLLLYQSPRVQFRDYRQLHNVGIIFSFASM